MHNACSVLINYFVNTIEYRQTWSTTFRIPIYQMINERNANPLTCSHWHVLFLFQKQPWVPRKTTEGPRRPLVNCDAWKETQPWVPRKTTEGPRRPLMNCDAWEETNRGYLERLLRGQGDPGFATNRSPRDRGS